MKDRNGKTLRAGYIVRYHCEGAKEPEPGLLKITRISSNMKEIEHFEKALITGKPPFAFLENVDKDDPDLLIPAPFFSHEIGKLALEELI